MDGPRTDPPHCARAMSEALSPSSSNPPVDPLADRLRRAIAHAFHARTDHDVTDELRDAVCAFVRSQREVGTRIEEVVIAVKAAVDLADLRPIRTIERRELTERRSEEHTSELQSPCNLVCRL